MFIGGWIRVPAAAVQCAGEPTLPTMNRTNNTVNNVVLRFDHVTVGSNRFWSKKQHE
jgi:hypothetical protein